MNKIKKFLVVITILLILSFVGLFFFYQNGNNNKKTDNIKTLDNIPADDEPYTESRIIKSDVADNNKEVELKYDEYVVASGFIGASDIAYFTRNKNLYQLTISKGTILKIAEGVKRIEEDKDSLMVYKGKKFKIVRKDDYIMYVD